MTTGNGFPAALYTVFKIMWYRDNEPDIYRDAFKIIGTKDYINFRLTGVISTDHSYASGSGVYDLGRNMYHDGYIRAAVYLPTSCRYCPFHCRPGTISPGGLRDRA